MILELTLMAVGGAVMAFLLVHKRLETDKGPSAMVSDARAKADPILRNIHKSAGEVLSEVNAKNAVVAANKAFVFGVRSIMRASEKAHSLSSAIVEKASKKREDLTRSGAASFYLKQIKESKDKSEEAGIQPEKM